MCSMEELVSLARRGSSSLAGDEDRPRKKHKGSSAKPQDADLPANAYPYPVVPDDHCESPKEAYADIRFFLLAIAAHLNKTPATLAIFDPYFCEGSMKERLRSLGFSNVYNEKKDFYELIDTNALPPFDVLVTNPPYSGDHMERLLRFCTGDQCQRPWFLLLPNYVYMKDYYEGVFKAVAGRARLPFYVTPAGSRRYLYSTPKGRRQEKSAKVTSPFPTFWYCQLPEQREVLLSRAAALRAQASKAAAATVEVKGVDGAEGQGHGQGQDVHSDSVPAAHSTGSSSRPVPGIPGIVVALSASAIPLEHAPDNDPRKRKLRNNQKRAKNKQRHKQHTQAQAQQGGTR